MIAASNPHTTVTVLSVFGAVYLVMILRMAIRGAIDLYDLMMLSTVAFVPLCFVLFPDFAEFMSKLTGVLFPFVVMFGLLFLIIFIFVHRITVQMHKLASQNRTLVQEIALVYLELEKLQRGGNRSGESS